MIFFFMLFVFIYRLDGLSNKPKVKLNYYPQNERREHHGEHMISKSPQARSKNRPISN